jgi:hypothetical protein
MITSQWPERSETLQKVITSNPAAIVCIFFYISCILNDKIESKVAKKILFLYELSGQRSIKQY